MAKTAVDVASLLYAFIDAEYGTYMRSELDDITTLEDGSRVVYLKNQFLIGVGRDQHLHPGNPPLSNGIAAKDMGPFMEVENARDKTGIHWIKHK